ncbi:transmembrane protein 26-like [Anneissia japonica]|uniref:transmembrane protein 26-like n=1 Tax=Anneissia japonica TaxID=1529436 RepID=UPI00142565C0|nr:transmembrane protein 26-like [Anneissia japonica]
MSYFKAILTRVIFALHSLFAIYILTIVTSDTTYWGLSIAVIPLLLEAVITLTRRKGKELKWICPSVFLYLLAVVPSVWIMEGVLLENRQNEYNNISLHFKYELNSSIPLLQQIQTATEDLPKSDKQTQLVLAVEQFLPFVLIIGRWIMPAGALSRDKLSQLLLVYIGLAADIIEFLETYKEDPVKFNGQLIYAVLTLWTWSLLQFVFVITMTRDAQDAIDSIEEEESRSKTRRKLGAKEKTCIEKCCCYGETDTYIDPNMNLGEVSGLIIPQRMEDIEVEDTEPKCQCLESEVWGIMLTLCLQDVPFLVLRMVLIIHFHVFSRTNIFYSFKNALMLSLQIYRLSSLYHESKQTLKPEYEKEREGLKNS